MTTPFKSPGDRRRPFGPGRGGWLLLAGVLCSAGTGCQDVLFDKKDPRTQFETHDRLRQRYVPLEEKNVFGETQPALRARLSPQT